METYYCIKEIMNNTSSDYNSCYEMVKSLFTLIRPSCFKEDCYCTDVLYTMESDYFKEICNILACVTSDLDTLDFFQKLKNNVFGDKVKPFYYLHCIKKNEKTPSFSEYYIMNKVVEFCYSMLIFYNPFRKYVDAHEIKLLDNDANVKDKAVWIAKYYNDYKLEASLFSNIDLSNFVCEDKDISGADLLKPEYQELRSVDKNLESRSTPFKDELFWDNLIFSRVQTDEFKFDYYRYIDLGRSIHSIKEIINLFDQKAIMRCLNTQNDTDNSEKFSYSVESLWTALMYDTIYHAYIIVSLINGEELYQTSIKSMYEQFYKQYIYPAISERAEWNSVLDKFFSKTIRDDESEKHSDLGMYRKVLHAFNNLYNRDGHSYFDAFKENLPAKSGNTHFALPPEFYETMMFFVILFSNVQNNKYTSIENFKAIYSESVALDSTKQKTDYTIFNYEVGWYLFTSIFNYTVNQKCSSDSNYESNNHPSNIIFSSEVIIKASQNDIENIKEEYNNMVYVLTLVLLKYQFCYPEKYQEILCSIKSLICSKQATSAYNIDIHFSPEELSILQRRTETKGERTLDPKLKEELSHQGKTINKIRRLLEHSNFEYSKKEIMYYCDGKKSAVEKALSRLFKSGEIRYSSYTASGESYYERNIETKDLIFELFNRNKQKKS